MLASLRESLKRSKQPREPALKLCNVCEGKGCESRGRGPDGKEYEACRACGCGGAPWGLGIQLKCFCSGSTQRFQYIMGPDAKHFAGAVDLTDMADLTRVQNAWGDRATAVLLVCQNCQATHLCKDGDGTRRAISGLDSANSYDKAHNKEIAKQMVANGILDRTDLSTYHNP